MAHAGLVLTTVRRAVMSAVDDVGPAAGDARENDPGCFERNFVRVYVHGVRARELEPVCVCVCACGCACVRMCVCARAHEWMRLAHVWVEFALQHR